MTRQRKGTKVDFIKSGTVKPFGTVDLIPCLQSSQQPHQASKGCYSLAGEGTAGFFGGIRRRNSPKSTGIAGMSDGNYVAWLLAQRGY